MNDYAAEQARVFLQNLFQVSSEFRNIGRVFVRVSQDANLLKETAAVRQNGKRKIFIDSGTMVDQANLVRLAYADD